MDDFSDYINGELARIDDEYEQRTLANRQYNEAALVNLVVTTSRVLEEIGQIPRGTTQTVKTVTSFIHSVGKLFRWW